VEPAVLYLCFFAFLAGFTLAPLLGLQPAFLDHSLDQLIDELVQLLRFFGGPVFHPFTIGRLRNAAQLHQLFDDLLFQSLEALRITGSWIAVLEAALQKEVGEVVEQFFKAQPVKGRRDPLCVFGYRHGEPA